MLVCGVSKAAAPDYRQHHKRSMGLTLARDLDFYSLAGVRPA